MFRLPITIKNGENNNNVDDIDDDSDVGLDIREIDKKKRDINGKY